MKGDMYLSWSSDEEILNTGEHGGAVTALLKFALESEMVDAILAVKKRDGTNRYDGVLDLITDPEEVKECAGSLHCAPVNIARCVKEYLDGATEMEIALPCKPCDARGIIELAKRYQIERDNLLLVGLNCTGTLSPAVAKEMLIEEYKVDPNDVVREDIEARKLIITLKDGTKKENDLEVLEEKAYGRRENCRRCDVNIPRMADIACGKWGVKEGEKKSFIEVCSDKGSELMDKAIESGCIKVETPDKEAIKERDRRDKEAIELASKQQEKDFDEMRGMRNEERQKYWFNYFDRCIKCFGCRDACPICYCKDCYLEADRGLVRGGEIPPDRMFPLVRLSHVADSCVNCGQCQDVCPAEIPLSKLYFMLNQELSSIFKYVSGMNIEEKPPLAMVTDEEFKIDDLLFLLEFNKNFAYFKRILSHKPPFQSSFQLQMRF
jgi:formate dehydrogenase subunit beta